MNLFDKPTQLMNQQTELMEEQTNLSKQQVISNKKQLELIDKQTNLNRILAFATSILAFGIFFQIIDTIGKQKYGGYVKLWPFSYWTEIGLVKHYNLFFSFIFYLELMLIILILIHFVFKPIMFKLNNRDHKS